MVSIYIAILVSINTFNQYKKTSLNVQAATSPSTYYVSTTGNDTNIGTRDNPFKTITQAVAKASPGTTIYVFPGTYTKKIYISNKLGTPTQPITVIGESANPGQYPVLDGGDPSYSSTIKDPMITVQNSQWINFERIKVINSTDTAYRIANSHYITVRRNIIDYHSSAILLKTQSSHILVEYNDIYQSYPSNSTWSQLKASKWEGGAFKSDGGAGMNTIRYNYFHDQFNAIFLTSGYKTDGRYYDANTWIYHNRFENIVDDAYEPESFSFNNHFFNNTLINTHRLVSFAPGYKNLLGPVYVYNNMQIINKDPTLEAATNRINSGFKIDLSTNYYANGVFAFNNSVDASTLGTNAYAIDFLNANVNNFSHYNHIYKTAKVAFTKSALIGNGKFNFDISNKTFGYVEPNGIINSDPMFSNSTNEDLRLLVNSPARAKSKEISNLLGFSANLIVESGSDLGAFQYGENNFRKSPSPIYLPPTGGEYSNFPTNYDWSSDIRGGVNPLSDPIWINSLTPISTLAPTLKPTVIPTLIPTTIPTLKPIATPTTIQSTQTLLPQADSYVSSNAPTTNFGSSKVLIVNGSPIKIIYLKYDLSNYVGKTIKSASLKFAISDNSQSTQNIKLVDDISWQESTINFNNKPSLGAIISTQSNIKGSFATIDITNTVKSKLGNILSMGINSTGNSQFKISSREGYSAPTLILNFQ
ncbi:MAG: DNRLRE domain-containing protein [Candidatus Shapirobacteria bacterium]